MLFSTSTTLNETGAHLHSTVEGHEYEVITDDLAGGNLPCPCSHTQETFALKECPAYVPTTAPGGVAGDRAL